MPERITINDEPPHTRYHSGYCSLCESEVIAVTKELSPLLFVSGFKLLDMVIEWAIRKTTNKRLWRFEQKITELNSGGVEFPDFIGSNDHIRDRLIGLYTTLAPYRNQIIHGGWGQNNDGRLAFDFSKNNQAFRKAVPFEQVLRFSEVMADVADLLVSPGTFTNRIEAMMIFKLNELVDLHGKPALPIRVPRLYEITRVTAAVYPLTISLKTIRDHIAKISSSNDPIEIDLRVESCLNDTRRAWHFAPHQVPLADTLVIDDSMLRFEIAPPRPIAQELAV